LKFDKSIKEFGFKENEDNCIYAKLKNGKFILLILYVDDILLTSSDVNLLLETKKFLSSNFDMKDLGEASFVIGIEIHLDRRNGVLGQSQKAYLENALNFLICISVSHRLSRLSRATDLGIFRVLEISMRSIK
jgi:hypothetical protein